MGKSVGVTVFCGSREQVRERANGPCSWWIAAAASYSARPTPTIGLRPWTKFSRFWKKSESVLSAFSYKELHESSLGCFSVLCADCFEPASVGSAWQRYQ